MTIVMKRPELHKSYFQLSLAQVLHFPSVLLLGLFCSMCDMISYIYVYRHIYIYTFCIWNNTNTCNEQASDGRSDTIVN